MKPDSFENEEQELAIFLHKELCHYNHADGCSWEYEKDRKTPWCGLYFAHNEYLGMARRMLEVSDFDTIKKIIQARRPKKEN
jgi:hypothetical protein